MKRQDNLEKQNEELKQRNERLEKTMMEVLPEKIHDKMQVLFDKRDEENPYV